MGEGTEPRKWREENGVIYFSVTSDGTTGSEWIERLEGKGFQLSIYARRMLCSPYFRPTDGVTTEVAVLKGMLFKDEDRITSTIRAEATRRKLSKPNAEFACLIREKFTDKEIKEMGFLWIMVMHEPINDSGSDSPAGILRAGCGDGDCRLCVSYGEPYSAWACGNGFAFVVSETSTPKAS